MAIVASSKIRKTIGSRVRHHVRIAIMSAVLIAHQACLFHGGKTGSPVEPAATVSIAVLPLNVGELPQVSPGAAQTAGIGQRNEIQPGGRDQRLSEEEPRLRSLSIASAVVATRLLHGIPGIEPVPIWQVLFVASGKLGNSRNVTPSTAAELANMLNVRWTMMGEISPGPEGYVLLIDFIPAKQSLFPFRYQRGLQPELLTRRLNEALEQFLRYAGHPVSRLTITTGDGDWSEISRLAQAVDREYGWFSSPAPGNAQSEFATLSARDPRLASLLFNPDLYAAAAGTVPREAAKPAEAGDARRGVESTPVLAKAATVVPDQEPPTQPASPPPSLAAGVPENSKWAPLIVPPILSLPAEQQLPPERRTAAVNRRTSAAPSASAPGYGSEPGGAVPPRAPGARYVLQLFALANETEARRIAQDLIQAGAHARVSAIRAGGKTVYRVSVGTYNSPDTASVAGDALVALVMADEYWIRTAAVPALTARTAPAAEPARMAGAAGSATGEFQVQVFASGDREKAAALVEELRQIGLQARIEQFKVTGKGDYYRVRLIGYQSRREAVAAAEKLRAQGRIREYWIVS